MHILIRKNMRSVTSVVGQLTPVQYPLLSPCISQPRSTSLALVSPAEKSESFKMHFYFLGVWSSSCLLEFSL